ncbi:unnamed protein product [Caenorhabditis nigoni]
MFVFKTFTVFGIIGLSWSQPFCPGNTTPFDYQECNPEIRSECPSGFTCRKTSTTNSTGAAMNLCCESGRMTISDWFSEKHLTPDIVPQTPFTLLQTITLSPASTLLNFPPIHVGDEVVVLSFPGFITGVLQSVTLSGQVNPGYVHVVTIIDPLYKPFAVLMNYNIIVGQPTQTINVTSSRFVAYLDNSASMPRMDSYRSEYVVLVYYTASQIFLDGNTPKDQLLGSSCSDTKCLLTSSPLASKFSQPLGGTVFYITTKNTVLTQKIDGDVGIEELIAQANSVTVDPANPFNIPTINWEDILKNIPTIPPLVLPTLDPNFWQNIPTIPPIVLPTLDPNFWQNLPTLPPLPTLDPDFWKNLPTLPPLPTLDPNFWQNLISLPTLPPLQFPTLDPNFWKNLPTLPPIPTPTPRTAQCTYKLGQEILTNSSFAGNLNYTNVQSVLDEMLQKSVEVCNGFQTQKLTDLSLKYGVLQDSLLENSGKLGESYGDREDFKTSGANWDTPI